MFNRVLQLFRATTSPQPAGTQTDGTMMVAHCDQFGIPWAKGVGFSNSQNGNLALGAEIWGNNFGAFSDAALCTVSLSYSLDIASGGIIVDQSRGNADDGKVTLNFGVPMTQNSAYSFNGTTFDRDRSQGTNADTLSVLTLGAKVAAAFSYLFNGTTWDRIRSLASNSDGQAAAQTGLMGVVARIQGYNGATWDRIQTLGDTSDANATGQSGHVAAMAHGLLYTGSNTWARARTNSAATLSSVTQPFGQLVADPGEWTLTHAPAAATQATATKAAGAAGVRHVLRSIQATVNAVAAQAAPLTVVVRDGATGVGTILWQDRIIAPIGTDGRVSVQGLNIVGSAATAMTIEFTAAPAATDFETISGTGYSTI